MKKLALAIGLGSFIVFGASGGTLAYYRADGAAGSAAIRDSRIGGSYTGASPWLLLVNEHFYPDTAVVWDTDNTFCSDGSCLSR